MRLFCEAERARVLLGARGFVAMLLPVEGVTRVSQLFVRMRVDFVWSDLEHFLFGIFSSGFVGRS